jgi:DNA mismatch endonuclease (patch repair protein)
MQAIRRTDTKPELALRSALHRLGYRFRKDFRIRAYGTWIRPDIVFTRKRLAVFVDGCFWHSCPDHGRQPKSNEWYWLPKLERTKERDVRATALLEAAGWRVVRLWEHEYPDKAVQIVTKAMQDEM